MRGEAWVAVADESRASFTKVVATLGRECREWPEGATHSEIQALIEENCREDEMIVYTDGSTRNQVRLGIHCLSSGCHKTRECRCYRIDNFQHVYGS